MSFSRLLEAANTLLENIIDSGDFGPDEFGDTAEGGNVAAFPRDDEGTPWYPDVWELKEAVDATRLDRQIYDSAHALRQAVNVAQSLMDEVAIWITGDEPYNPEVLARALTEHACNMRDLLQQANYANTTEVQS
ncbi:MAG: hypothetical protein ACOY3P_20300 [Planctomycetota bacterium]